MIDVASIRAAANACAGDAVGISKMQLDDLLVEIEMGQRAQRELKILGAISVLAEAVGTDGVSVAN